MGQFGMSMPGRVRRTASMNIYTGLLFAAVVSLAVACGVMYFAAVKVGASGNPLGIQEAGKISFAK